MELHWKDEVLQTLTGRELLSIPIEGDIPLPTGRSCTSLLGAQGDIGRCTTECGETVRILGDIRVELLCEEGEETFSFLARSPFSHTYEGSADEVRCTCALSELAVSLLDGSIHFTAVVQLDLVLLATRTLRTLDASQGMECLCQDLSLSRRSVAVRDTVDIREEIAAQGVSAVRAAFGAALLQDISVVSGTATVSGTLYLSLLTANDAGELCQSMQQAPFCVELDCPQPVSEGQCELCALNVHAVGEGFGILAVEAQLSLTLYAAHAQSVSLPLDAYAPGMPFVCAHTAFRAVSDASVFHLRHSLSETLRIPESMPEATRVLCAFAQPTVTEASDATLTGIIDVRVVYESASQTRYMFTEELPFTLGVPTDAETLLSRVTALPVCGGAGRTLQIAFTLCVQLCAIRTIDTVAVTGVEECAPKPAFSGVMVCFAGEGETLYDIAKRYDTTRTAIRAISPALPDALSEGQRVVMLL
ncbi:MAG: LysM domain-containing protein [Clostridia bacterium]|nr:LysM domain-containing protein [Clostridia bacterium]